MITSYTQNVVFAARKLLEMNAPFPVDRDYARTDLTIIVSERLRLPVVSVSDGIRLSTTLDIDDDVVYTVKNFNQPVIAAAERGYVVYDNDPVEYNFAWV